MVGRQVGCGIQRIDSVSQQTKLSEPANRSRLLVRETLQNTPEIDRNRTNLRGTVLAIAVAGARRAINYLRYLDARSAELCEGDDHGWR